MKSIRIVVEGKVQGVGFRYFVLQAARKFNINGYVKNLPDRTVFIEACGNDIDLAEFVSECRKGPSMSRVTDFNINEIPYKNYNDFRIERY